MQINAIWPRSFVSNDLIMQNLLYSISEVETEQRTEPKCQQHSISIMNVHNAAIHETFTAL